MVCQGQKEMGPRRRIISVPMGWLTALQHRRYKAVKICFVLSSAVVLFITVVNFYDNINLYLSLF